MPTPLLNKYNTFSFDTKAEERVAQSFNHLQKIYFQNERMYYIELRDNLVPNVEKPTEYFLKKAYLDGQISIFTYLIDLNVTEEEQSIDVG